MRSSAFCAGEQAEAHHRRRLGLCASLGFRPVPRDRRQGRCGVPRRHGAFCRLVAGGAHPSPFRARPCRDDDTHKTLRGPRGGMILTMTRRWPRSSTRRSSPASRRPADACHRRQGGRVSGGVAALLQDLRSKAVVENAKALAESLKSRGFDLVTGGTDNHLMLVDLRSKNSPARRLKPLSGARTSPATRRAFLRSGQSRW